VLSNFEDSAHGRKFYSNVRWPVSARVATRVLRAALDSKSKAILDELVPLEYEPAGLGTSGLPAHVRAASALRRLAHRLVIVQDDIDALAVRDATGPVRPVLLPARPSGRRVFDDATGNKHEKLDLEACVVLADERMVAFGSGSMPVRERLVVWNGAAAAPTIVAAEALYAELRGAVTDGDVRLNLEGAVVAGDRLLLFHRGNDAPRASTAHVNAIAELEIEDFVAWLEHAAAPPRVAKVTRVDLGAIGGVPFGFTDAVAVEPDRIVVLACAEDSACAISDGPVLGARVGVLDERGLRMVDVYERDGGPTRLKLEGIERRAGSDSEFDVVADTDRPDAAARLGRLEWEWR
jgi:hypothetical protein